MISLEPPIFEGGTAYAAIDLSPEFADRRGALAARLSARLDIDDWTMTEDGISVASARSALTFTVDQDSMYASGVELGDRSGFLETTPAFLASAAEFLEVKEVSFLGTSMTSVLPARGGNLNDLRRWLTQRLGVTHSPVFHDLPGEVVADKWEFELEDVARGDHTSILIEAFDRAAVVGRDDLPLEPPDYPDVFVYLSLRCLREDEAPGAADIGARWSAVFDDVDGLATRIYTAFAGDSSK